MSEVQTVCSSHIRVYKKCLLDVAEALFPIPERKLWFTVSNNEKYTLVVPSLMLPCGMPQGQGFGYRELPNVGTIRVCV